MDYPNKTVYPTSEDSFESEKNTSSRRLARELDISRTNIHRILKDDLHLRPYKKVVEPFLTDEHKEKIKQFSNWVRTRARRVQDFWTGTRNRTRYFFTCLTFEKFFLVFTSGGRSKN